MGLFSILETPWKSRTFLILLFINMVISHEQQLLAQDWPQLSHYKTANAQLGAPAKGEHRVVFMGNSITIGWLSHYPEYFEGKPYINRGIGGQTTPQMLLRFQQDVINLKPAVVVILAGTNDIAGNTGPMTLEQIMDNLRSMTQLAKANDIQVVLASVLPAFDYSWKPGMMPNQKIPELNRMIKRYAREAEVVYLDYFSAMTDGNNGLRKVLGEDGVHPNRNGYQVMAPLTEKAISEALSIKAIKE